ncbi:hypothetical protein ACIQXD_35205 [Streptomyces uncialis]|uniref:hypothetical protein n=1 Tax=Streptomyces uncialis TaxID=1048205 RepID=UPI0038092BE6
MDLHCGGTVSHDPHRAAGPDDSQAGAGQPTGGVPAAARGRIPGLAGGSRTCPDEDHLRRAVPGHLTPYLVRVVADGPRTQGTVVMDRVSAARPRLVEIRGNLIDRIAEAKREGWLGEVEGLETSLAGAEDKLSQMNAATSRTVTAVDLGMPTFTQIAGRATDTRSRPPPSAP